MGAAQSVRPPSIATADGSLTYLHPVHGASYRSTRGAATESRHVFLEGSGLVRRPSPWRVLELGFGSGMNFQTTQRAAREAGVELFYTALEPEPMDAQLWLVDPEWRSAVWGEACSREGITLTLERAGWQRVEPSPAAFEAVYHDPFGPAVAPECWTAECFRWAARALCGQGALATYGASSAARQAMLRAGLRVGVLPGAPGKREMTVAAHRPEALGEARPWRSARAAAGVQVEGGRSARLEPPK
jgi:tRNA U34 5-methylaminomethyl-2-thiouridine-forming methyltransferase MnmC